jgi:hypothetical protein
MWLSDAVPYKTAAADDGSCKLILEAAKPFRIVAATEEFARKYGMSSSQATNRTLGIIQGPETDPKVWLSLFDGAMGGRLQQALVTTYLRDGTSIAENLTCTPVLGSTGISFFMVNFGRCTNPQEASRSPRNVEAQSAAFDDRVPKHVGPGSRRPSMDASTPSKSSPSRPVSAPRGTSMGSINRVIELKARAQQAKLRMERAAAQKSGAASTPQQARTGVLSFLMSVVMMVLALLNLAPPAPQIVIARRSDERIESPYKRTWLRIHSAGMSDNDLEFFSPY